MRVHFAAMPNAPVDTMRFILNEPAPCTDCRFACRCGEARFACDAFAIFMNGGSKTRWSHAPRVPNRERYQALLG